MAWISRRSSVYSKYGIVASSQPLASSIGINILEKGGTAADAAVAIAAALNVVEPCSTGIGGDAFALYYNSNTKEVSCLMGNGSAPAAISLEYLNSKGIGSKSLNFTPLDPRSGLCVTVPGAAALWEDLVKQHGNFQLSEVLAPAISLAENGFSVGPLTGGQWSQAFIQGEEAHRVLRPSGSAPKPGDIFTNPDLGQTFREVATKGAVEGFYKGRIAQAIVDACQQFDGVLSLDDLENHKTQNVTPCSTVYKGYRVYETPPPTHGIAALIALNMLQAHHQITGQLEERSSIGETHRGIEAMRLAFADALLHVADPSTENIPIEALLNSDYANHRITQLLAEPNQSNSNVEAGNPLNFSSTTKVDDESLKAYETSETVYFCVIDQYGNGCSMINSNYMGFGTGIVPIGCGFTLQNRGHNFSLIPGHPNQIAPRKKPYHTIIPSLVTREHDSSLYATLGVMGGFMQPQGHLQVIRNLIDFNLDPQTALDAPRWYIAQVGETQHPNDVKKSIVLLEDGYGGRGDSNEFNDDGETIKKLLEERGHNVLRIVKGKERSIFGRGQVIVRYENGMLCGGSDPRADGCAIPCIFSNSL